MAAIKIDKKISKYRVQKAEVKGAAAEPVAPVAPVKFEPAVEMTHDRQGRSSKVVRMTEEVQRPEFLIGATYKIKTPVSDHAMYVTINDIILNEDTPYEQRRPFEIFINSKNLDHFQWIVALTRIISAVFRKGGDVTFLVAVGRQIHALHHCRARLCHREAPADDRVAQEGGARRACAEAHRREEGGVPGARQADGCVREIPFSRWRAAVRQMQHGRRRHDGWLHDLPELRRLEMRMTGAGHR
jgi:hypothetical protein